MTRSSKSYFNIRATTKTWIRIGKLYKPPLFRGARFHCPSTLVQLSARTKTGAQTYLRGRELPKV